MTPHDPPPAPAGPTVPPPLGASGAGARTHLAKDGRAPTRHHHPKEG
jgi:hypothetical protein